jgi:hypothetical protein
LLQEDDPDVLQLLGENLAQASIENLGASGHLGEERIAGREEALRGSEIAAPAAVTRQFQLDHSTKQSSVNERVKIKSRNHTHLLIRSLRHRRRHSMKRMGGRTRTGRRSHGHGLSGIPVRGSRRVHLRIFLASSNCGILSEWVTIGLVTWTRDSLRHRRHSIEQMDRRPTIGRRSCGHGLSGIPI